MREILFRGKRIDNGEWIYGSPIFQDGYVLIRFWNSEEFKFEEHLVAPESVSEYTGLTDKNGNKIFEGDIVTMPSYGGGRHKSVIYFKKGKFAVDGSNYSFKDIAPKNMEVIGNIHDNPELLKESK